MKSIATLIAQSKVKAVHGSDQQMVAGISLDSRAVKANFLFAAIPGAQVDGYDFIDQAIAAGAQAVLCEKLPEVLQEVTYIQVEDAHLALGQMAAAFYEYPSNHLKLVGITGTNGKTSIASMLYEFFMELGYNTGLLSTIKYSINGTDYNATHTTPHAIRIQELLAEMVESGCDYAFMEVSSHAIDQQRIAGLSFDGGVFTNITHDHLDYHDTFKDYLYTKKRFFDQLSPEAFALYNRDDKNGLVMVQNVKAVKYSYSLKSVSDFKTRVIESDFDGMLLDLRGDEVWVRVVGKFNAYNVLAVYAVAFLLGVEHFEIITALSKLHSVEGRFQHLKRNGVTVIIDYAHTPDALLNVLDTITAIRTRNEKVISVLGCGGNRDKEKRPIMAKLACQQSDQVVLTSDNPRDEDPQKILDDMMQGVEPQHYKKVLCISDREEAIKTAITMARPGDVILVAGKGHEKYQEIKGVKHPFDDKEVVSRNLKLIQN